MAGIWLGRHLWEHFAFGGDVDWLKLTGYPLVKGAAEFAMDWLIVPERDRGLDHAGHRRRFSRRRRDDIRSSSSVQNREQGTASGVV